MGMAFCVNFRFKWKDMFFNICYLFLYTLPLLLNPNPQSISNATLTNIKFRHHLWLLSVFVQSNPAKCLTVPNFLWPFPKQANSWLTAICESCTKLKTIKNSFLLYLTYKYLHLTLLKINFLHSYSTLSQGCWISIIVCRFFLFINRQLWKYSCIDTKLIVYLW